MAMTINIKNRPVRITLEKVLATICFLSGIAFLIVALLGLWRHFFTMGICFAVGVMISDEADDDEQEKKRHKQ